MRKQKLLFMTIMLTLVFTGCKKKETTDLSSLHTTAAIEKETIQSTSEPASTETLYESTAANDKDSGGKYSVKTEIKSHTLNNATVEYPEISGMKDTEKQKQVNELLRQNALSVIDARPLKEGEALSVKATVESSNLKRIAITYRGELKTAEGGKGERIFYSGAVDLETATNLRLSDYADAYTVAGYIASGDYKLEAASGDGEQAIRGYINGADKTTDYYYKKLSAADFSGTGTDTAQTFPELFSYEKEGVVYLSLPLPKELGDYAIIRYSPDNK